MIDIKTKLLGVVPKKGSGTLEDGQKWETDRVDLHCLTPLDDSKGALGSTTSVYKLQGHDQHIDNAKSLVGKDVVLRLNMVTKGSGSAPNLVPVSVSLAK